MGEYFRVVCHDCKKRLSLRAAKLREIALNLDVAAAVGHFAVRHAGHHIELSGDERTFDYRFGPDDVAKYAPAPPPACEDEDIAHAVSLGRREGRGS